MKTKLHQSTILLAVLLAVGNLAPRLVAQTVYTPYTFINFAGQPGVIGSSNGVGSAAQFYNPQGVALDAATNLYVADELNHQIRRIAPDGTVTVIAGSIGLMGFADGVGLGAPQFNAPMAVAIDTKSNLYVADTTGQLIRKITPSAVVTTLAGQPGVKGHTDATGTNATFNTPTGIGVDSSGNVYVSDQVNRTIRKITPAGVVSVFAGSQSVQGTNDGQGILAQFYMTTAVVCDSGDNIYVADNGANTIRKITPGGLVSTFAGVGRVGGTNDGVGDAARFSSPQALAVDSANNVFVCDTGNNTIRMITPGRAVTTIAGNPTLSGSADGTNSSATFSVPRGIAVDSAGIVYVSDAGNNTIRKITHSGTNWIVTTLAGSATGLNECVDATNSMARFHNLYGMVADGGGNVFVVDRANDAIRKITPAGAVTTFAGTPGVAGSVDGTGAEAVFDQPGSICVDSATNIYVGDYQNNVVRKISPVGTNWVVTTLAGNVRNQGTNDAVGTHALFSQVHGLAVDASGNVFASDLGNLTVRKITPAGSVSTFVGAPGQSGGTDGTGNGARLAGPIGIAVNPAGGFVLVDGYSLRTISAGGVVTTIAGCPSGGCTNAIGSADGPGLSARFGFPAGVAVDASGNIYVADFGSDTIRRLTGSGINWTMTTLGGVPGQASFVEGTGSAARLNGPQGIAVDGAGKLYVGDSIADNIVQASAAVTFGTSPGSLVVSNGVFLMNLSGPLTGSIVIETSTNLLSWAPVQTNLFTNGISSAAIPLTSNPGRFFRARYVP